MADDASAPVKSRMGGARVGAGRKRKLTPAQIQDKADAYFADCAETGQPYTITDLALALGMISRHQLDDYEADPRYSDIIRKARSRVEAGWERRLHAPAPTGAIFALKSIHGWKDGSEIGGALGQISALLQALDARDVTPKPVLIEVKATREDDDGDGS